MLNSKKNRLEDLAEEIAGMDYSKFTEGEDYASLAKRYSTQGKKAMDDTIGKVAARTGGLASSYATAAGNQAYSGYMEKLEDAARAMYDDQRQEKIDQFGIEKSVIDNTFRQTSYDDERADKMISDEKTALASEFYHSPYAYATFADYKKAFPNTLLTKSDFNQIKGTSIGQYKEDNKQFNLGAKEDEEEKLYDAIYNNANIYPDYASYKEAFPNSLLSKSDFERIVSNVSGAQERASNTVTPAKMSEEAIKDLKDNKIYPNAAQNARYKELFGEDIPYYFGDEYEGIYNELQEIVKSENYNNDAIENAIKNYADRNFGESDESWAAAVSDMIDMAIKMGIDMSFLEEKNTTGE